MDPVFEKTRELGDALLHCDAYKRMKAAEEKAMGNQEASALVGDLMEHRAAIQQHMQSAAPDPVTLKRLSDEMDDIQEKLQLIDDITALNEARNEFNSLINQINQVLQFIVTGRMDDAACGGDCSACSGCH